MNPWASSADEFFQYHKLGINRLSIGMQSAVEGELRVLSRGHNQNQVEVCVKSAQKAGIFNINLDLIFGIPGQTLSSFKRSLELAFALHPMHLSLYALSIEEGTPLAKLIEQGEISSPDPDLAADMYEYAMDYLELRGFVHYEISNWALGEKNLCRHNLQYWKNKDYLGFGAGAHSLLNGRRWSDVSQIPLYISALSQIKEKSFVISPAEENVINLSQNDKITDTMIMGLRLVKEGVCEAEFRNQHGQELDFVFKVQISLLENQGLLEWIGEFPNRYLRLTRNGRLLGNQVFVQFLRDEN
jgi:oxygen-independent coproporphyrinogen-3 oxidase